MRLVYEKDHSREVKVGDTVEAGAEKFVIEYFRKPSSANSSGKVTIKNIHGHQRELYTHVLGLVWIEREDRADWE